MQGDIIHIINESGAIVTTYTYSAFGEVLSVTGSLASTIGVRNPFRYRSYYYDTETGWYYLNSRYYDPTVGRFINADDAGFIGANGNIQGYNLFSYCNNNPIMFTDQSGHSIEEAIRALPVLLGISASDSISIVMDVVAVVAFVGIAVAGTEAITTFPRIEIGDIFKPTATNDESTAFKDDVIAESGKNTDEANPSYFAAELVRDPLTRKITVVVGKGISREDARIRMIAGLNVMCSNAESAKQLVFGLTNLIYEIDCGKCNDMGYYYHYHINGLHGEPHIWHYGPPDLDMLALFGH